MAHLVNIPQIIGYIWMGNHQKELDEPCATVWNKQEHNLKMTPECTWAKTVTSLQPRGNISRLGDRDSECRVSSMLEGAHATPAPLPPRKARPSGNSIFQTSLWCLLSLHSSDRRFHLTDICRPLIHTHRKQISAH